MNDKITPIQIDGKEYITSNQASKLTGYSRDYIGQLVRKGKIVGMVMDRIMFISKESLDAYKVVYGNNIGSKVQEKTLRDEISSNIRAELDKKYQRKVNSIAVIKYQSEHADNEKKLLYKNFPSIKKEVKVNNDTSAYKHKIIPILFGKHHILGSAFGSILSIIVKISIFVSALVTLYFVSFNIDIFNKLTLDDLVYNIEETHLISSLYTLSTDSATFVKDGILYISQNYLDKVTASAIEAINALQ